jgi:hypothetical protein
VSGFLGVDPGGSGGFALVFPNAPAEAWKMPETDAEIWALVSELRHRARGAVIELVGPGKEGGRASMFKFGGSYFGLRMALTAAGIPFTLATPQKWKRAVDGFLIAPKATPTEKKRRAREVAGRMFPHLKVTNATADALLIAQFAMQDAARREGEGC